MLVESHDLQIELLRLRRGTTVLQPIEDDGRLFLVDGEGGGAVLELQGTAIAAWLPMAGQVRIHTPELSFTTHAREALVTEPVANQRCVARANSRWFAVVGGRKAWDSLMPDMSAIGLRPLPAMQSVDRELRRAVVALARCAEQHEITPRIVALMDEVATRQAPLHAAIARSPGRTHATRLQTFLRLQHVRIFMAACCEKDLSIEKLAGIANYSPCHFVRTFKVVFQQTPHVYLIAQRLRLAERLLRSGELAVTEVALASGFENRSAFSRCYRQHFGVTASEARLRACAAGCGVRSSNRVTTLAKHMPFHHGVGFHENKKATVASRPRYCWWAGRKGGLDNGIPCSTEEERNEYANSRD